MPTSVRGRAVMTLSFWWAIGALFLAFLAWLVMPVLGWRYLIFFSSLPLTLFTIMATFLLPESPMYLALTGQKTRVQNEINKIAKRNKKPALVGELTIEESISSETRGRIQDLFISGRRRLTLQIWLLWFMGGAAYYGAVLLSTELLNSNEGICLASGKSPIDGLPGGESECSAHVCQYVKICNNF